MAAIAARLSSSGAAKSGKPWARLTAPCCKARRDISRITDSVNCRVRAARNRSRERRGEGEEDTPSILPSLHRVYRTTVKVLDHGASCAPEPSRTVILRVWVPADSCETSSGYVNPTFGHPGRPG